MSARNGSAALLSAFALAACAPSYQRVTVTTLPAGAEVYLQRSGVMEVTAAVAGFYGSLDIPTFQDAYYSLGTAPIDYEFRLKEPQATVVGGGAYGDVTRRYTEGRIRVVRDGFRTVERAVRFTGEPLEFDVTLEPVDGG